MPTEEKRTALLEKLVLNASTTAVQTAYSTKPTWAKDLENLLMKTKEKADDAEDAAEALNIRLTELQTCTFSIALDEKTTKRTTAHQSRIYNYAKGPIEKHLKDKLPNISVPPFEKEGNAMIASFKSKTEAATFAKSVNEDKLSNGEKKTIYVKPQLPPEVVASQAPLKRALAAYKATIDPKDDNQPYIHWESRSIIHNKKVVVTPFQNGGCGGTQEVSDEVREMISEAVNNRFYFQQMRDNGDADEEKKSGPMLVDPQRGRKNAAQNEQDGKPVKQLKAKDDTDSKARNPVGRPAARKS